MLPRALASRLDSRLVAVRNMPELREHRSDPGMRRGGRGKGSGGRGGDARRGGGGRGGGGFDRTSAPPPQPLSETYKATVKSVALEAAPFGVFVELTNPGARHHGKGGLLKARSSPVVAALAVGDVVRALVHTVDDQGRLDCRLSRAATCASGPKADAGRRGAKPLLILDLNGVLCDRGSYKSRGRGREPDAPRPHAADFVAWCYRRFTVGVWSCARRENMDLSLFEGRDLAMAWDQNNSTSLWPRCSQVSAEKPLFLKEIDKVFQKSFADAPVPAAAPAGAQGMWRRANSEPAKPAPAPPPPALYGYDAANTVLVDNHLEKFERNPLGTCVLVETWTADRSDDAALAPGGALRQALDALAACDDCAALGRAAAEAGTYPGVFPAAHPEAPPLDAQTPRLPPSPRAPSPRFDERVAKAFAETYCASKSHRTSCPDWPARKYLDKRDSPGPRARPLKRRDLATVATARWYATEKTDGERHWLFHDGADGCWLLRRDLSISRTFAESIPALACGGPTIFDGEIVPEKGSKHVFFVVFDAVRSLGDDVGALRNAPARLAAAAAALAALAAADLPVAVVAKTYHDGAHFDALRPALAAGGGVFRDGTRTTECDGVVLAAERDAHGYYDAACFKYKPTITLDVRLKFPHHDHWAPPLDVDAAVADGPRDVTVTSVRVDAAGLDKLGLKAPKRGGGGGRRGGKGSAPGPIAECEYAGGYWRVERPRHDKRKPNSLRTAWSVLESIADATTVDDVAGALAAPWAPGFAAPAEVADAAKHYDERQQQRNANVGLDATMHRLRRLNNFAKALVLDAFCVRHAAGARSGLGDAVRPADLADPAPLLAALRAPKGKGRRSGAKRRPAAILELGCGRGGDLGKYRKSFDVTRMVACDISTVALAEAESRWASDGADGRAAFVVGDLGDAGLADAITAAAGGEKRWANYACCHFAFHYGCGSSARVDALLRCVDANLDASSGVFAATIVDWRALRDHLAKSPRAAVGGALCVVEAPESTRAALAAFGDEPEGDNAWGLEYEFSLGDAVQKCTEFVVHAPSLVAKAEARGLKLAYFGNFAAFLDDARRHNDGFAELAANVGVRPGPGDADALSDDQFAVASLYATIAFSR